MNEVDPGPLARLGVVIGDAETAGVVFQRLTDAERPETLREIAKAWGLPAGRFVEWFTTQHGAVYDAALKVKADQLAHGALEVVSKTQPGRVTKTKGDGSVEVTEEDMLGHRKLYSETMLKLAGKWDRERYGDRTDVKHSVLVPTLTIEIVGTSVGTQHTPEPRVIEHEPRKIEDGII